MSESTKPFTTFLWVLIPAGIALGLSLFLLYYAKASGATIPGCHGQSGCHAVLGSRWASWLNIPVAALAAVCYFFFMILTWFAHTTPNPGQQRLCRTALAFVALTGLGTIGWFIGLQLFEIKKICLWCMTDHLLGVVSFIAALIALRLSRKAWISAGLPAAAAIVAFVALHVLFPPLMMDIKGEEAGGTHQNGAPVKTANLQLGATGKKQSREVSLYNGQLKFDLYKVPVLGSRDAPHVIVELFDYTCKHCRQLHPMVGTALDRYGENQVCLVVLPAPLSVECNAQIVHMMPDHRYACDYARYGLAINAVDPDKFEAFHDWLMTGEKPPLLSEVRKKATDLVGKEAFDAAVKGQKVKDWISDGVSLFTYFDADAIPKLITAKRVANLRPTTPENLYRGLDLLTELKPAIK